MEPIDDDFSKPSYEFEHLLSEASNVPLPSRRRHWMNTRLRTKLLAGGTRQHFQQIDYSTSETDDETSGECSPFTPIPHSRCTTKHLRIPTETPSDVSMLDCLPQLFSDHELARSPSPQLSLSDNPPELSLPDTSAQLLTHPSPTDYLSNSPLWPNQAEDSNVSLSRPSSPSMQ